MNVYATTEPCTVQWVWIDAEYQQDGFAVDPHSRPITHEHTHNHGTRAEIVAECRDMLRTTHRRNHHRRTIARLTLCNLGETDKDT